MGKPNALKRKSEEKKEDVAKLEGAWSLNWRSLFWKLVLCWSFYILLKIYKFLLLFVLSFIWYWKFIFFHSLSFYLQFSATDILVTLFAFSYKFESI